MKLKQRITTGTTICLLCAAVCGAGLTGCGLYAEGAAAPSLTSTSAAAVKENEPAFIETVAAPDWKVTEHSGAALEIPHPGGIACSGDRIYICDPAGHRVAVLDRNFQLVDSITGGEGENGAFSNPADVQVSGGKIYLLDAGQNRLDVLNLDGTTVSSHRLLNFSAAQDDVYAHLAVLAPDQVAFSVQVASQKAGTYMLHQGTVQPLTDWFWGSVYAQDGKVYAINQYEFTQTNADETVAESGTNSLLIFEDDQLKTKVELPYMYSVSDFVVAGDQLYLLSSLWNRLDRFDLQGNYQETIAQFSFEPGKPVGYSSHLAWDDTTSTFYITAENSGVIYEVQYQPA